VALVRYDVSEQRIASILFTLMMKAVDASETSVPTRSTRRHIPEDGILSSHPRDNLKSYKSERGFLVEGNAKLVKMDACIRSQITKYSYACTKCSAGYPVIK
jgi:hypothetical protein